MLMAAAGGIVVEALRDIVRPQAGPRPFTLLVLFVVVAIKEGLFRFVSREAGQIESAAIHADAWHHRSDVVTSIAAGVGIAISLLGGQRFAAADDLAAILAASFIAWNGGRILRPAFDELMDRQPGPDIVEKISELAGSIPEVERIERCVVRKAGNTYLVDMHVEVDPKMTVQRGHAVAHAVKDKVRGGFPAVQDVLVHIEPHWR
jgi:cation diffusion facilitator family transporter